MTAKKKVTEKDRVEQMARQMGVSLDLAARTRKAMLSQPKRTEADWLEVVRSGGQR